MNHAPKFSSNFLYMDILKWKATPFCAPVLLITNGGPQIYKLCRNVAFFGLILN